MYIQKLRPRGLELQQGELGDLVEQEMAATSAAVESAAARIEVRVCVLLWSSDVYLYLLCVCENNSIEFKESLFVSFVDPNRKCSTSLEQLIQESRWRSMRGKMHMTKGRQSPDTQTLSVIFICSPQL